MAKLGDQWNVGMIASEPEDGPTDDEPSLQLAHKPHNIGVAPDPQFEHLHPRWPKGTPNGLGSGR